METAKLAVQGMSCQSCVANVGRVLKAVPGVADATVTLHPGAATVTYDAGLTNVAALAAAIRDAGYGATE